VDRGFDSCEAARIDPRMSPDTHTGEFIGHHAPDRVTNLMDEVVDEIGDEPDTFTAAAARQVLKKVEW
jgi:hypothetical protein